MDLNICLLSHIECASPCLWSFIFLISLYFCFSYKELFCYIYTLKYAWVSNRVLRFLKIWIQRNFKFQLSIPVVSIALAFVMHIFPPFYPIPLESVFLILISPKSEEGDADHVQWQEGQLLKTLNFSLTLGSQKKNGLIWQMAQNKKNIRNKKRAIFFLTS